MTTSKQIATNQQNALLSTGAITSEGKAIIAKNAIKHGIFTEALIIDKNGCKENVQEYQKLLSGLIEDLKPCGQMQYILVERIAVDCWRLKRVYKFENGEICKHFDTTLSAYYEQTDICGLKEAQSVEEINDEIKQNKEDLEWCNEYLAALKKGQVKFDKPTWKGKEIESDIEEDLNTILENYFYDALTAEEHELFNKEQINFDEAKKILARMSITDEKITDYLIQHYGKQIKELLQEIEKLEQQKQKNLQLEEIIKNTCCLPIHASAEKALRYEHSLQKSIMQNLVMLKKLQGINAAI